jgi:hypothetical protein
MTSLALFKFSVDIVSLKWMAKKLGNLMPGVLFGDWRKIRRGAVGWICDFSQANFKRKPMNLIEKSSISQNSRQISFQTLNSQTFPIIILIPIKTKNPREDENLTNSHAIPHLRKRDNTIHHSRTCPHFVSDLLSMKLKRSRKKHHG